MKRLLKLLPICLGFTIASSNAQQKQFNNTLMVTIQDTTALTNQERTYAINFLQQTEAGVYAAVKELSKAQLTFKPSADKWSVLECVEHIAAAEQTLWAMANETLQKPANPQDRAGIKFSDNDLVKAVEDRSHKSKTFTALEPVNSPYKSVDEALAAFKQNREKLIAFVRNTPVNLRSHVAVLPVGTYDIYQFILLISAHTNRHTQQIEEVKADISFPKK